MVIVNILVEGQTEETFVKELLYPFLYKHGILISPVIVSTKRIKEGGKFKGGLTNGNFDNFIDDIKRLIKSTPQGFVTIFIDYYHIPTKFPGYKERLKKTKQLEKVLFLEQKLSEHLGHPRNFIPYIQLHEFESFHFSDEKGFAGNLSPEEANLDDLFKIIRDFKNPEDINENPTTAPSKRILAHYPSYEKVNEGNIILMDIGIEKIIEKCPHFRSFIEKLLLLKEKTVN